jgi:hypothetical protein
MDNIKLLQDETDFYIAIPESKKIYIPFLRVWLNEQQVRIIEQFECSHGVYFMKIDTTQYGLRQITHEQ